MINVKDAVHEERQKGPVIIRSELAYGSNESHALSRLDGHLSGAVDGSSTGILIDLGETIFIGCGFLNVLIRHYAQTTQSNRRFGLCALNPMPASVLAITRLDTLWEIFQTREGAIQSMKWPMDISVN